MYEDDWDNYRGTPVIRDDRPLRYWCDCSGSGKGWSAVKPTEQGECPFCGYATFASRRDLAKASKLKRNRPYRAAA